MKHQKVAIELSAANMLASKISHACTVLNEQYQTGKIDQAELSQRLEELGRHHVNELQAIILNLSYEVKS